MSVSWAARYRVEIERADLGGHFHRSRPLQTNPSSTTNVLTLKTLPITLKAAITPFTLGMSYLAVLTSPKRDIASCTN